MTPEDIKRLQDKIAEAKAILRDAALVGGKHRPTIGGDSKYVFSTKHSGSWIPDGLEERVTADNIHVNTNHSPKDGTIQFYMGVDVPKIGKDRDPTFQSLNHRRYFLSNGIIYPSGLIDFLPKPTTSHTNSGTIDERAVRFILKDHLDSKVRHPQTGEVVTVANYHGLQLPIQEDLRRWFKEKWTAQDGSECGDYKGRGRVKCRPSKRVSDKSPETWSEMSPKEKKKAVRLKQKAHREGKQFSSHKSGKTWDGKKNKYKPGKKKVNEMYETLKQMFIERKLNKKSDCGCDNDLQEAKKHKKKHKKPYKGFKKGKNHPEGGLSRAEARRQGIHAGIETKDEAKRKGGFNKLSKKTQKRRKSFCARMCGMKRRRTSSKTARDPKSKINAALRVWGCRCGTNESYEPQTSMIMEKRGSCWEGYKQQGMKNKNGKMVPNCVPVNESVLTESKNKPTNKKLWSKAKALARKKFKVYPSAYANAWAAKWYKKRGGDWRSMKTEQLFSNTLKMIVEEIVNKQHKGSMTKKEIAERDRLAKKVKGIKAIKGKDSDKNAKYRYATFVILNKRGGGGSKEKSSTSSSRKNKKKKKK